MPQDSLLCEFIHAGNRLRQYLDNRAEISDRPTTLWVFPRDTDSLATITSWSERQRGTYCRLEDFSSTLPGSVVYLALRNSAHVDLLEVPTDGKVLCFSSMETLALREPQRAQRIVQTITRIATAETA